MKDNHKPFAHLRVAILLLVAVVSVTQQLNAEDTPFKYTQEELEILGDRVAENGRAYKYPSIMIEDDFHISKEVKGWEYPSLRRSLTYSDWDQIIDPQGRMHKLISPEITYAELIKQLNFHDQDVTVNKDRKADEPHSYIITEWANCEITYLGETYNGNNADVKLTAVVFDNEKHKEHLEYVKSEEEAGWIGKLLKYVYWFSQ